MILPLVTGAGLGLGVLLLLAGLFPSRPPLAVALARLQRSPDRVAPGAADAGAARAVSRAGSGLAKLPRAWACSGRPCTRTCG